MVGTNLPSIRQEEGKQLAVDCSGMQFDDLGDGLLQNDSWTQNKTIICVDDNFVNLSSFRLQLEMMGFKGDIRCFQSSQLALDFIYDFLYSFEQKKTLDLVLTDSNMPIMSGITMVIEINKMIESFIKTQRILQNSNICNDQGKKLVVKPVIYMYTDSIKQVKQNTISSEIDYLVAKPVRFKQI